MKQKFNLTGHKKLWEWLANNPEKEKRDYFSVMGMPKKDHPESLCYACEYDNDDSCRSCPLDGWNSDGKCLCQCISDNGLYGRWEDAMDAHDYETACKIAHEIANLPVRAGVECV